MLLVAGPFPGEFPGGCCPELHLARSKSKILLVFIYCALYSEHTLIELIKALEFCNVMSNQSSTALGASLYRV